MGEWRRGRGGGEAANALLLLSTLWMSYCTALQFSITLLHCAL